jgi:low affinity Fe/Cu permease
MEPVIRHSPISRSLRWLDGLLSRAAAAAALAFVVATFFVVLISLGFRDSWQLAFSTVASAITLVMVFVLHHTQRREQAATQLKLDELIRALPQADDRFVRLHVEPDEELLELEEEHIERREATLEQRQRA